MSPEQKTLDTNNNLTLNLSEDLDDH